MFERIRCYISLKKADRSLKAMRTVGVMSGDIQLMEVAEHALLDNEIIRERIWKDRKLAKSYNRKIRESGCKDIMGL